MATAKTASFLIPTAQPGVAQPYAQESAMSQIEQQRLADALAHVQDQGTTQPLQAGRLSALNLEGAGNSLREALLIKQQEVARKKAADISGSYQKDLLQGLKAYTTQRDGQEVPVAGPPAEGEASPTRTVPGNPLAFKSGQLSAFPEIRGMAEEDRKSQEKLQEKLVEKASPASALAAGWDNRLLRPKSDQKVVNNSVMEMGGEVGQAPTVLPGMGVTQSTLPSGTMVNTLPGGKLDAVDKAPKTEVKINLGDHPMQEAMKLLPDDFKAAQAANRTLRSTETALSALKEGARTGAGEDYLQSARTAIEGLTGLKFDTTTPTAVVAKALAENVVNEFGGKLGAGISNADVLFMKEAMGGLATDAHALDRILAIRAAAAYIKIQEHNRNVEDLTSQPGVSSPDYIRRRFSVESAKFGFAFKTPEARASFESGLSNQPYETVLQRELADTAKTAGKSGKYSPDDLKLFQQYGYTPKGN